MSARLCQFRGILCKNDDWNRRNASSGSSVPHVRKRRIGSHKILSVPREGAMGVVYLAARADGAFSQTVALKNA
jgi:hypothetical protein